MRVIIEKQNSNVKSIEIYKSGITAEIIRRYVEYLDVSEATVKIYLTGIRRLLRYLSERDIKAPSRNDIIEYKREILKEGLKSSTVALYLTSIRRLFAWTAQQGLYANIAEGIKSPKQDKGHKKDYLSADAMKAIMKGISRNSVEGLRNYAMIALMTCGGLRTVEVIRANVEDIRTLGDVTVLYVQGKGRTDKKEFIKITPKVADALREYFQARGHVSENEPLFVSESRRNSGKRLTTRTVSGVCKHAMRQAGYDSPRLTAHSLRHTAVTLALTAGQTLASVQMFARHTSISTTQIYAHNLERINSMCEASISEAIF